MGLNITGQRELVNKWIILWDENVVSNNINKNSADGGNKKSSITALRRVGLERPCL
jgi:hypothetical protein